jgi:hypothetical protein
MRTTRSTLAAATLAAASAMATLPARAEVVAQWIQIGPGDQGVSPLSGTPTVWARAITTDGSCPALSIDGAPAAQPLAVRFSNAPDFPVTQCEAVIPLGHRTARIGEVDLKLPVKNPRRILVIADTGCRMNGAAQQNCSDPKDFPFRANADYAASLQPDLVVHIGDYFYRDTDCRGAFPGCDDPSSPNYEPFGDNWASWRGDVFDPARKLLAAAPWVMVRGNHESCGRGAKGWYSLLDPKPYDPAAVACAAGSFFNGTATSYDGSSPPWGYDLSPTFVVPIGETRLLVHDSSFAIDARVDAATARRYETDLTAALAAAGGDDVVFLTHKPTFALVAGAPTNGGNFTEQFLFSGGLGPDSAFASGVPYKIGLFLSGHVHQTEYLNFMDFARYAPQVIIGVGGSQLDAPVVAGQSVYAFANEPFTVHNTIYSTTPADVERAYARTEYGFALLHPQPRGFELQTFTLADGRKGRCSITLGVRRGVACNF